MGVFSRSNTILFWEITEIYGRHNSKNGCLTVEESEKSMMKSFLDKGNVVAVVGATINKEKFGYKVYKVVKKAGFKVYPVNPKYQEVDGDRCYASLKEVPEKPDVVITIVPPKVTEEIVRQCKELGIGKVWMQPGSESEKAISYCHKNGIEVVHHACFVVDGLKGSFDEELSAPKWELPK